MFSEAEHRLTEAANEVAVLTRSLHRGGTAADDTLLHLTEIIAIFGNEAIDGEGLG